MKYKTIDELKEELGEKFEQFLYDANIELLTQRQNAIDYIKSTTFWGIYEDVPFEKVKYGSDLLEIFDEDI